MANNTQNMQIFTIIGQLEDLVENSPKPKIGGGATKRVVDIEEIMDLLGDLKTTIPEDIRRANSVIIESQSMMDNAEEHAKDVVASAQQDAEAILAKANAAAQGLTVKAQAEYERLISEDEIFQEAQRRARLLAMKAEANAAMVFDNAKRYADDVLRDLENFLGEYKQLVAINRKDLDANTAVPAAQPQQAPQAVQNAPAAYQQQAEQPAQSQPAAHKAAAPVPEEEFDDDDFDDDEEESGSLFSRIFGKKKKVEDIDFDDEDDIQ